MKNIYILINLQKALRIYPVELFQNKNPATLFYWLLPWWQLSHLDFIKISEDLKSFGKVKTDYFHLESHCYCQPSKSHKVEIVLVTDYTQRNLYYTNNYFRCSSWSVQVFCIFGLFLRYQKKIMYDSQLLKCWKTSFRTAIQNFL